MTLKTNKFAGAGIVTAVTASLCCITPVLALISGASGIASAFSWLEPLRPYLTGITIVVLAFAWYLKLKPAKPDEIKCNCEEEEKKPFLQSTLFLAVVTLFAVAMLAFPYYSDIFYPDTKQEVIIVKQNGIFTVHLNVEGMTCEACNNHIEHAANELTGVIEAKADYKTGTADITYDKSRVDKAKIIDAINKTGYKVKNKP